MSDTRTASILQRVPVILAVTAASYGLPATPQDRARAAECGRKPGAARQARTQHAHAGRQR